MHRPLVTPGSVGKGLNYPADQFPNEYQHISIKYSFYFILCKFVDDLQNSLGSYQFNRAEQLHFPAS